MLTKGMISDIAKEAGIFYSGSLADLAAQQDRVYRAIELAFAAGAAAERDSIIAKLLEIGALEDGEFIAAIRARKD